MKVIYWIMMCLTYLQGITLAVWSIGYIVYYFIITREYEDFDVEVYVCVIMMLMGGMFFSVMLAILLQMLIA